MVVLGEGGPDALPTTGSGAHAMHYHERLAGSGLLVGKGGSFGVRVGFHARYGNSVTP